MELAEAVRRRRMVRAYDPERPVPREVLDRLLAMAVRAPSAGFSQGWDFVVLTGPADRELFWAATADADAAADPWLTGMRSAPALLLCLSDPDRYLDRYAEPDKGWADRDPGRWPVPYWDTDVAMAAMLVLLGLVDEGLAGCFFGVPPERHEQVRTALGIPANRRLVGVVSAGYPAADRRSPSLRRGRRPVAEVAHDGAFDRPWTVQQEVSGSPTGAAPPPGPAPSAPGSA